MTHKANGTAVQRFEYPANPRLRATALRAPAFTRRAAGDYLKQAAQNASRAPAKEGRPRPASPG